MRSPKTLKTAMIGLILMVGVGTWSVAEAVNESDGVNVLANVPFTEELKGWSRKTPKGEESNVVFKVQETAKGAALCVENKAERNAAGNTFVSQINSARFPLRAGSIYSLEAFYMLSGKIGTGISLRIIPVDVDGKAIIGHYFWIHVGTSTMEWNSMEGEWVPPTNAVCASLTVFFNGRGVYQITGLELNERTAEKSITFNGKTFLFTPRNKEKDMPLGKVSRRDRKTGLLIYQRAPRMVYPDSVPQSHEVIKEVSGFGTPGERKGLFFTVYALRNVDVLAVKLERSLVNEKGETIPAETVTIKEVKFWAQRTGWNARSYYIIPELLEESTERTLPAERNRGFWLDIKTPSGIGPGDYKSEITVNTGSGKPIKLPLRIKIMPFELMAPEGIDWITYADIDQKQKQMYSDAQLRRYLLDMKEYGISGLIYFGRNKRGIDLIKEIGFTGPMLDDLRIESLAMNKMGIKPDALLPAMESNKDFQKACMEEAKNQIKELRYLGLTNAFYAHLGDEPAGVPERMKKALFRGKYLKDAGVQTWCTAYGYEGVKQLAPFLDADVNGYQCNSEENNRCFRDLAAQYNMQLWYLGAGCYCYIGQEGGLMPDRYQAGFLFYKIGSPTHVSWVYQRPVDDPFTDFDGEKENPTQLKDACITYPARIISDQQVTISTLQWEGIREGIIDCKYLYTLKRYAEQARAKGFLDLAGESEKVIKTILDSVPWYNDFQLGDSYLSPGNFSNDMADALRWTAARQIEKILTALNRQ